MFSRMIRIVGQIDFFWSLRSRHFFAKPRRFHSRYVRARNDAQEPTMPDGKRKRRHSQNQAKRRWYAMHRARRFKRRFWLLPEKPVSFAPPSSSHNPSPWWAAGNFDLAHSNT
jgi:hypothetical protein